MFSVNIYLFKVNNINTRKRYEICSNLTLTTPERCQRRRSGVSIANFEHFEPSSSASIVEFEQVNVSWVS